MYQTGDMVVHPGHGGCTVQGICHKQFGGETKRYYVLIPESDPNTTIFDPVDNAGKIGLRNIISSIQADQVMTLFSTEPADWIEDNTLRRQHYEKALGGGDLTLLVRMIKGLILQAQKAALNQHDKALLPRAKKKLLSEVALAKGIDLERAGVLMEQAIGASGLS